MINFAELAGNLGFNLDDVESFGGDVAPGDYLGVVEEAKIVPQEGNFIFPRLSITYDLQDRDGKTVGKTFDTFQIPDTPESQWDKSGVLITKAGKETTEYDRNMNMIKALVTRVRQLGFVGIKDFNPENISGMPIALTLKKSGEYTRISKLKAREMKAATLNTAPVVQSAPAAPQSVTPSVNPFA